MFVKKKGQVWVETVTYTLIALVLIGLILAFVKPKIDELQDKALIEQSIGMLKQINSVINEVSQDGVGNKRLVEISISKGDLTINSSTDTLSFLFKGAYMYSEPGQNYSEGSFNISTTQLGSGYNVLIEKQYSGFNLTYSGKDSSKVITSSSSPYQIFIENKGGVSNNIDFSLK